MQQLRLWLPTLRAPARSCLHLGLFGAVFVPFCAAPAPPHPPASPGPTFSKRRRRRRLTEAQPPGKAPARHWLRSRQSAAAVNAGGARGVPGVVVRGGRAGGGGGGRDGGGAPRAGTTPSPPPGLCSPRFKNWPASYYNRTSSMF